MDFNFKKLADVEALTEVPENANALVEVDGVIKRAPGAGLGGGAGKTLIFVNSNFTAWYDGTYVPEESNAPEEGQIPAYDPETAAEPAVASEPTVADANTPMLAVSSPTPSGTYTANMTFEEAYAAYKNCELTGVISYECDGGTHIFTHVYLWDMTSEVGIDCLGVGLDIVDYYWTAENGLSTEWPGGPS